MKMGERKNPIMPKHLKLYYEKAHFFWISSCCHVLHGSSLDTHWCLCLHGRHHPFHLCHSPGWTYALTFLPIIQKRETWLFNQTKSPTLMPCRVFIGWLDDSTPSMNWCPISFFFFKGGGSRNQKREQEVNNPVGHLRLISGHRGEKMLIEANRSLILSSSTWKGRKGSKTTADCADKMVLQNARKGQA